MWLLGIRLIGGFLYPSEIGTLLPSNLNHLNAILGLSFRVEVLRLGVVRESSCVLINFRFLVF
jgi:hypothetical protein